MIKRDDPLEKGSFLKSNEHFVKALKTIPLASQTFSKSYLQWPLGISPMFLKEGKGCRITDLDDNNYIDYVMGLMSVILGYSDKEVNQAVCSQLQKSVLLSMPHPKELELAEKLKNLIPYADMVRFGKNGSDATSAAIRISRAFTGRDLVAFSGYHGWHDWYIGKTTRNLGVPKSVTKLSYRFPFNDADALHSLVKNNPKNFAAVMIEPESAEVTAPGFLKRVREICDLYGIVLIYDEIICGFRVGYGGTSKVYDVYPDLGCFGKSMANGFPLSALVGNKKIMKLMEDVFVSGTFSGDVISLTAGLVTIDKLVTKNIPTKLAKRGKVLITKSNKILEEFSLKDIIHFSGNDWWPRLNVNEDKQHPMLISSLLRQEFVRHGLFLGAGYNLCLKHDTEKIMLITMDSFKHAITQVNQALNSKDPYSFMKGNLLQKVFKVR